MSSHVVSLNQQNLLLNGARLKNTRYVFGCAVYTGQQTKMAINSVYTSKNKWSTIERGMNEFLGFFLFLLLLEVAVCTGLKYWMVSQSQGHPWYSATQEYKATVGSCCADFPRLPGPAVTLSSSLDIDCCHGIPSRELSRKEGETVLVRPSINLIGLDEAVF